MAVATTTCTYSDPHFAITIEQSGQGVQAYYGTSTQFRYDFANSGGIVGQRTSNSQGISSPSISFQFSSSTCVTDPAPSGGSGGGTSPYDATSLGSALLVLVFVFAFSFLAVYKIIKP